MNDFLNAGHLVRREFIKALVPLGFGIGLASGEAIAGGSNRQRLRIGMIGLSVHSADFTEIINVPGDKDFEQFQVTAIYHPPGNPDVEFSQKQLDNFTERIKNKGVEFCESIEAVLAKSDAVMLLTNDGRPHLEQVLPVFKTGKPVYIDKPLAESLDQVKAIFDASERHSTPVFSCSALRYGKNVDAIRSGSVVGQITGADTFSPAPLQPSHVDLFWDGIHGVELLYAVMGPGCRSVSRIHAEGTDVVVGTWEDKRVGVFRGIRKGRSGFGGTVFGLDGIAPIGGFGGYRPLVLSIAEFFQTGRSPVSKEETIEIYAFMEAADESKRRGGAPVTLSSVMP